MGVGEMVRPGKLDLLFCISHLFDCVWAGGHYSFFVSSKDYIGSRNLQRYGH